MCVCVSTECKRLPHHSRLELVAVVKICLLSFCTFRLGIHRHTPQGQDTLYLCQSDISEMVCLCVRRQNEGGIGGDEGAA